MTNGRSSTAKRSMIAALIVAVGILPPALSNARTNHGLGVPAGYTVGWRSLADGVDLFTFVARGSQVVRVARVSRDAPYVLRPIVSQDRLAGPGPRVERTSAMCARTRCLLAINGDFFSRGVPVGGLISDGHPLRSPITRPQVVIDDAGRASLDDHAALDGVLVALYPRHVAGVVLPLQDEHELTVDAINVARAAGRIVAYTPVFGPRTETAANGAELVAAVGSVTLGQRAHLHVVSFHEGGNSVVRAGTIVLSGSGAGAAALRALWRDVRSGAASADAWIRFDADRPASMSMAGNPVVLRAGGDAYPRSRASLIRSRNPRTIIAWTKGGDILLVTVDGRRSRRSNGMNLREAAAFLRALGATDALNLDGGGSTTMVAGGKVLNVPSDRMVSQGGRLHLVRYPASGDRVVRASVERAVATALAIVPR